jgi:AraC-like DNA-binding protein
MKCSPGSATFYAENKPDLVMPKNIFSMTDLTSYEVADYCGYRNAKNFNLRFKSATSMTPLAWRRTHPPRG